MSRRRKRADRADDEPGFGRALEQLFLIFGKRLIRSGVERALVRSALGFTDREDRWLVWQAGGEGRAILCCLENLISNAVKPSPGGASFRILLGSNGNGGEFHTEDQGPGVRDDEICQLFERFNRLSARPTGGEPSAGLDLPIVHEFATAMRGASEYRKSRRCGTSFPLRLPEA